ncbi:MAG: hypothetical protein Q9212_002671 [Teloschistes hypoglaucus]
MRPSCSPTNATDRLASALVYRANPELDIRYQLPWNFGTFLWDIPARLGKSAALDAASDVLVTAHAQYCAGRRGLDQGLLKKQSLAMSVLRQHLLDPAKAFSSETLCAITLMMFSQLLTDPTQEVPHSHIRGAAGLLKAMKARRPSGPMDELGKKLVLMMRALVNDKISFTKQEWEDLVRDDATGSMPGGRFVEHLAYVPDLTRRAKAVMQRNVLPHPDWTKLRHEVEEIRDQSKADIDEFRTRLQTFDPISAPPKFVKHLHATFLRLLSLALGTGIIINWILLFLLRSDDVISHESAEWVEEIIVLSEIATQYLPLGALAMDMGLRFAWFGATEASTKAKIQALIKNYERAMTGEEGGRHIDCYEGLMKRLSLEEA